MGGAEGLQVHWGLSPQIQHPCLGPSIPTMDPASLPWTRHHCLEPSPLHGSGIPTMEPSSFHGTWHPCHGSSIPTMDPASLPWTQHPCYGSSIPPWDLACNTAAGIPFRAFLH